VCMCVCVVRGTVHLLSSCSRLCTIRPCVTACKRYGTCMVHASWRHNTHGPRKLAAQHAWSPQVRAHAHAHTCRLCKVFHIVGKRCAPRWVHLQRRVWPYQHGHCAGTTCKSSTHTYLAMHPGSTPRAAQLCAAAQRSILNTLCRERVKCLVCTCECISVCMCCMCVCVYFGMCVRCVHVYVCVKVRVHIF